jgi:hypothetical protein
MITRALIGERIPLEMSRPADHRDPVGIKTHRHSDGIVASDDVIEKTQIPEVNWLRRKGAVAFAADDTISEEQIVSLTLRRQSTRAIAVLENSGQV